ncbi:MAG: ribosomal protein [Pseudonocardiales bacterium]|nr:ribosomal protein [Pseudonocardiales bacterium]
MEIVVRGRNVVVPDHFRQHVTDRLSKLERFDQKIIRLDVELYHEKNKRQSKDCERVEITSRTRGPVVRAEACADDFYKALEQAAIRLERRFRSTADRRRVHHGRHTPVSVAQATAVGESDSSPLMQGAGVALAERFAAPIDLQPEAVMDDPSVFDAPAITVSYDGDAGSDDHDHPLPQLEGDTNVARIVRVKNHQSVPMAIDQAVWEMELVGHDFFLFHDKESGLPSVVYRRKGFDYGVIRLTD